MKIGINIERKHLYGVIVLLTLGFFIIYTIGTPVKKSTGSHPLQQIAVGVGSNPLDSVDSNANGLIDNSDNSDTSNACNGDSVCEVNELLVNKNMTVNGNITLGGDSPTYRVKNVAIPIEDSDVATKRYVDAKVGVSLPVTLFTKTKYNGNLGGRSGADAKCRAEFGASFHFCECQKSMGAVLADAREAAWCDYAFANCNDWTDGGPEWASILYYNTASEYGWQFSNSALCFGPYSIACCNF